MRENKIVFRVFLMFSWAQLTYSSPVTVRWIYMLGTNEGQDYQSEIKLNYLVSGSWSGWTGIYPFAICQTKKTQ